MNEFSILCRVLGTLYYRQPQDPLLVPLFTLIREGKLETTRAVCCSKRNRKLPVRSAISR